jgi:hypothetical protein
VQIDFSALPDDAATLQLMLRAVVLQQGELAAENDKLRLLILLKSCEATINDGRIKSRAEGQGWWAAA